MVRVFCYYVGMGQITSMLPKSAWKIVVIKENKESMIEIGETDRIVYSPALRTNAKGKMIRKTLKEMLTIAADALPLGYKLSITEGYRSIASQKIAWGRMIAKLKTAYPTLSQGAIEAKARLVVAPPSPLANHNCGGAVDVGLVYENGTLVDMGTAHLAQENTTEKMKRYPMFPNTIFRKYITKAQEENRKILREAMITAGFVWYPGEWWHYCFGDRMWAVYMGEKECFYGPVEF